MSNRIQPTHFIQIWDVGVNRRNVIETTYYSLLMPISCMDMVVYDGGISRTIALFLIRPKTPQEQANSIYYPKPTPPQTKTNA